MNFKEKTLMKISFYLSFVFKELKKKLIMENVMNFVMKFF